MQLLIFKDFKIVKFIDGCFYMLKASTFVFKTVLSCPLKSTKQNHFLIAGSIGSLGAPAIRAQSSQHSSKPGKE